jgi:hypothetical protein
MKYDWTTAEAWGKTTALLLGSPIVYVSFCVACAIAAPLPQNIGLATGILAGLPVWVGTMYFAILARGVGRAWLGVGATALFLIGSVLIVEFVA